MDLKRKNYQRTTSWNAPYTFSSKEKDVETGYGYVKKLRFFSSLAFGNEKQVFHYAHCLRRFGARYYDSGLSIWLSVDPMSDKYPSMSPYNYCANNPVILVDPDGREPKWIPFINPTTGQIGVKAENGDHGRSLMNFFRGTNRQTLIPEFKKQYKTNEVEYLANNIFSQTYNHYLSNPNTYSRTNLNYNCFESAIKLTQGLLPKFSNNSTNSGDVFDYMGKNGYYKDNSGTPEKNATFGQSIILFKDNGITGIIDKALGIEQQYKHAAIFFGVSQDGTEYYWTKNGRWRKPEIMTKQQLIEIYGKDIEYYHKKNE